MTANNFQANNNIKNIMNYNISPLTNRLPGLQTFIQNQELNTGNIYSQGMKGSLIQVKK